jgi:hypothetical protein
MTISVPESTLIYEERQSPSEISLPPATPIEQEYYEFRRGKPPSLGFSVDPQGRAILEDHPPQLKSEYKKIESTGFLFNYPWLPPNALKLLNKAKKGPLTEKELVILMDVVADRATVHFQLSPRKFAAITFNGRVVELSARALTRE